MNFFSRLFRPADVKASRTATLQLQSFAAVWTKNNYQAFVEEGYGKNVVAYQAVNKIANAISTIKWLVQLPDGTIADKHPLLDLMAQPNPKQAGSEWWRERVGYLLLSGNNYEEIVEVNDMPRELWLLRPDRMTILPSPTGMPRGFDYKVGGQTIHFPSDERTGESSINHTKMFHPSDDWYGMSPVEPSAYAIDQHNEAMTWLQALLQNSARPSGALVLSSDVALGDEQFNRLKEQVDENYAGSRNAGRPMLLEGGLDWKQMGFSPMDMSIIDIKDSAARDISLAFGVPPLLLNIPGDNTFSNYREARLGLYEDTVIPFLKYITDDFNSWMSRYYNGAKLYPDLDSIEAIAEKRRNMWEMADASDDLTVNESRALKGYDPLPDPLGSMLMSELRSSTRGHGSSSPESPGTEKSVNQILEDLAYGRQ